MAGRRRRCGGSFSGSDATGGLSQALAAVTLAGVLLVLVLRRRGRRVLAVVLAATGVGMIATGALQTTPTPKPSATGSGRSA